MDLSALLLLCLYHAELGRVWTQDAFRTLLTDHLEVVGNVWRETDVQRDDVPTFFSHVRETRSTDGGRGVNFNMLPDNQTQILEDTQRYYSWKTFGPNDEEGPHLWIDLDNPNKSQIHIHGILSNTHRKASRVALSFDFPFYGHNVRQIIIATGGFIYMGEMSHRMLTATQYVAPLMANFDPSFSTNSTVGYWDNGHLFAVQWNNVHVKDREDEGGFTFQTVLHNNGSIVFSYRDVPLPVEQLNSTEHPVKVGLSDAFMSDLPDMSQRRIYEYHRVEMDTNRIVSGSSFLFTPLPTCVQHSSCELCLSSNVTLGCGWCNTLQRCSDGIDRHRQEWLDYNCPEEAKGVCEDFAAPEESPSSVNPPLLSPTTSSTPPENQSVTTDLQAVPPKDSGIGPSTAIIAGVVAALVILVSLTLVVVYYVNTHPTAAPPFSFMERHSNNYWPSMKFHNQSYTEVELGGQEKEGFMEAEQSC